MRILEIRVAMEEFNKGRKKLLKFPVINDHSLVNVRKKELHNVLEYKNYRLVAHNDMKSLWRIQNKKHQCLMIDTLNNCLEWLNKKEKHK